MTDVTVPWVLPDKLGDYTADRLGGGGQGIVYGVPSPPGKFAGEYLAYKEYLPNVTYDADVLYDMVCFRQTLSPADRTFLDERLSWPLALVYRGATPTDPRPSGNPNTRVVGFLMRRVTRTYELNSPMFAGTKQQALEFLLNPDAYATRIGLHVDDAQRVELLLDLARTVDRLHRHKVTVGDLSPKNVLFTLGGPARCLLIDCDSMRYDGKDVLPQVDTPSWEVPEPAKATTAADSWKFGLLAARVFNRDQDSKDPGPLRAVYTDLANLANRSWNQDPQRRPGMAEWLPALELAHNHVKQRRRPPPRPSSTPKPATPTVKVTVPPVTAPAAPIPTPAPAWQPSGNPRPVYTPSRPPTRSTGSRVGSWLVAAVLVGGVVGFAATHMDSGSDGSPSGGSSATATGEVRSDDGGNADVSGQSEDDTPGEDESTPSDKASASGATVDFSAVADDPDAEEVAQMFAEFYGAINEGNYDTALDLYDPDTATVDVDSSSSRSKWKDVMSTTRDSGVRLTGLSTDGEYTLATVHFTSHQDAGYGPGEGGGDTCDHWKITYQLTDTNGYRIFKAPKEGVSYASC